MKIHLITPIYRYEMWKIQKTEEIAKYGKIRNPLVIGQAQYFWFNALRSLGHSVEISHFSDPTIFTPLTLIFKKISKSLPYIGPQIFKFVRRPDRVQINRRIIDKAIKFQPDAILVVGSGDTILPSTVMDLKQKTNAKLAYLSGTSPVMFADNEAKESIPYFDCAFTNDYYHSIQWLELDVPRAVHLPISACDPSYHQRYDVTEDERPKYSSELCFVGRLTPLRWYLTERIRVLEAIADMGLSIWSDDKAYIIDNPKLRHCYRGRAFDKEMLKVLSSTKIALNLHGCFMRGGGNMRLFEIPAIKTFQIVDRYHPDWFEEGKDIVSFNGLEDLRQKITYYLEHDEERNAIAESSQRNVYRRHTYRIRMQKLLEHLMR